MNITNFLYKSKTIRYIGMFVYFPVIMDTQFEKYIKEVLDYLSESISEENESIRGLVLRIVKILIQKFGFSHTETLLEPIRDCLLSPNWRKRNGAINLLGEMIDVLRAKSSDSEISLVFKDYDFIITSVYILRYDNDEANKILATNVILILFTNKEYKYIYI